MEQVAMNKSILRAVICLIFTCNATDLFAHDTTHIHPLISAEIRKLITKNDKVDEKYLEIYESEPNPDTNVPAGDQFLYWGTDFDPSEMADKEPNTKDFLGKDQEYPWLTFLGAPIKKTTITGVVYEDVPFTKVFNHFYQAESAQPLWPGDNSAVTAMAYFNRAGGIPRHHTRVTGNYPNVRLSQPHMARSGLANSM